MAMVLMTGAAKPLKDALMAQVHRAQESGAHQILMIVPAQYTLQAEREALFEGSFRLHVLSPSRLYTRVFDAAGWPEGARIDDQGRVMLLHAAANRLKAQLVWYHSATARRGFAEKALIEIDTLKQAGLSPEDVRQLAPGKPEESALRRKLLDLALLYEGYEAALCGHYLDGEDEARHAAARMADAEFLRGAEVFVYGFDLISRPLAEALCALCPLATGVTVALSISDARRDAALYAPAVRAREGLCAMAAEAGIEVQRTVIEPGDQGGGADIRHLEKLLFSYPQMQFDQAPKHVQLCAMKNPQDEAEFAAALVRRLAMERGWRWRELAVMVQTLDETYTSALRRAFAAADVPLFLPASRPADRHPAARCVLSALRIVSRGWQTADMVLYLRAGFTGLDDDALDLLVNHILRRGLRGRSLRQPLRYLAEGEEALELWRDAVAEPLMALEARVKGEKNARALMTAVFDFMEALDLCGQLEQRAGQLSALSMREWAMEGAQVYGRILGAMDQMVELLSDEPLSIGEAARLLERALGTAQIKPLPQSADAVLCGSADHMKSQDVKALLVIGLSDQSAPSEAGLLTQEELAQIGGPLRGTALSAADRRLMERSAIKAALSFTQSYLLFSYPLSDARGRAQKPGALVMQVRRLLPKLSERGGQLGGATDREMRRMRLNAPVAAMARLGAMLGEDPRDPYLIALRDALEGERPKTYIREPSMLPGALAHALFSRITEVSISRLERYAQCPYQHFVRYALRPEPFREFQLTAQDEGDFYHAAMERFLEAQGARLQTLTQAESMAEMDMLTEPMLDELVRTSLGEGAAARAQGEDLRKVARRAAAMVVHQLSGSEFVPAALEIDFGKTEPYISLDGSARLGGRIDRIDSWQGDDEHYVRVIDYKTNGKTFSFAKAYYGLQMQLMIYLSAATLRHGGKPAGAFYFNISDNVVDSDALDAVVVEMARRKKLRLAGIMLQDERVGAAMSDHPEDVLPTRGEGLTNEADLLLLMSHARRKATETFTALRRGDISPNPASIGSTCACDHCDYQALCPRNPAQRPKQLPSLKGKEVMELLRGQADLTS